MRKSNNIKEKDQDKVGALGPEDHSRNARNRRNLFLKILIRLCEFLIML